MNRMDDEKRWKAIGWTPARGRAAYAGAASAILWLLGRTKYERVLLDYEYTALDHARCFRDEAGRKVVVSHPYRSEPPVGLFEACDALGLDAEWLPPSESWYNDRTSRVVFRLARKR